MQRTALIMGMPITLRFANPADVAHAGDIFAYFKKVDAQYSTYKPTSEISRINAGELTESQWSDSIRHIFALCEQTRQQTGGYFDIARHGKRDPSGLVKGWAIGNAANMLQARGVRNFYVDAGGDIQTHGVNEHDKPWRIGIRNPFNHDQTVKTVHASGNEGIATSGTYIRGQHVYNPHAPSQPLAEVMSLTVIGSNIYDADRFATAAFAMGKKGIIFIDSLPGFEGYMIDAVGTATMTRNFERFVA